ncbi:MAG: aldehyde dehydrogenase family protein, partial [Acidimicrobiia bacterium]|nr:aldehyde dehydrogenase family protein [Acidimicrobiia bacterium]
MLIDGQLVAAENGATFDNINPATEEIIGQIPDGSAADMAGAVAAARRAFDTTDWSTNQAFRHECLLQLQAAFESEQEELRNELVAEVGCPLLLTYGPQLDAPLREALLWPAEMIEQFQWRRSIGTKDAMGIGYQTEREVWKEPVGVVGVIVPWNFPVEITLNKLGPVLAMGNTCVLKPAPDTSANAVRMARLIAEKTDIPPGVVNIVPSRDHLVGEVITTSPDVNMVAFTGSHVTGRRIMEAASATLKPVFLELGGKSANIYLDDADLMATVPSAVSGCMHGGQGCAIPTRHLVPRARYDECVDALTAAFEAWKYGDPTNPENLQGPQISKKQQDRVLSYIEKGRAEGARITTGGGIPAHLPKGFYVEPTLFVDVDNSMTIAQEEIFGPVMCLIAYDDEEDAIAIANDSPLGLSGNIFSGDL